MDLFFPSKTSILSYFFKEKKNLILFKNFSGNKKTLLNISKDLT